MFVLNTRHLINSLYKNYKIKNVYRQLFCMYILILNLDGITYLSDK